MTSEPIQSQDRLIGPREAASRLGISYSTMKRWIYSGKIRSTRTVGGHYRVPESVMDKFLHKSTEIQSGGEENRTSSDSGRNQLIGRITDVKVIGLFAQIKVSIGEQTITSIMQADSAREMKLNKGDIVATVINTTSVMIVR